MSNGGESAYTPLEDPERQRLRQLGMESKFKVVVASGTSVGMLRNPTTRKMLAVKQLYAQQHGYPFYLGVSDVHVGNERLTPRKTINIKAEFTKVAMALDALRVFQSTDWILFCDHDIWMHPRAVHSWSLDSFIDTIPSWKHFAHANYHSMNTGVFFVRNSHQGRMLLLRWWAVITGPWIECHGWDQAAAQLLFLSQLSGGRDTEPFGFKCRAPSCGAVNATRRSCDASYREAIVQRFGPFDAPKFQRGQHEAADLNATEFFILRESINLPRLQCMDCQNSAVVEVRGMNYATIQNAVSGWFTSHKGMVLLHKSFAHGQGSNHKQQKLLTSQPLGFSRSNGGLEIIPKALLQSHTGGHEG